MQDYATLSKFYYAKGNFNQNFSSIIGNFSDSDVIKCHLFGRYLYREIFNEMRGFVPIAIALMLFLLGEIAESFGRSLAKEYMQQNTKKSISTVKHVE